MSRTAHTSRSASASGTTSPPSRRAWPVCAWCRRSAGSPAFTERFRTHERGAVRGQHRDAPHLHPLLPVHGVARDRRDRRASSASVGYFAERGHRHRRHRRRLRALPQQPVRAGAAAEPAVQHRAVVGRGAAQAVRRCSTPTPSIVERPGAVDLPAAGAIEVADVSFGYGDAADVLHDVSPRHRAR